MIRPQNRLLCHQAVSLWIWQHIRAGLRSRFQAPSSSLSAPSRCDFFYFFCHVLRKVHIIWILMQQILLSCQKSSLIQFAKHRRDFKKKDVRDKIGGWSPLEGCYFGLNSPAEPPATKSSAQKLPYCEPGVLLKPTASRSPGYVFNEEQLLGNFHVKHCNYKQASKSCNTSKKCKLRSIIKRNKFEAVPPSLGLGVLKARFCYSCDSQAKLFRLVQLGALIYFCCKLMNF